MSHEATPPTNPKRIRRQVLGRRLSIEPFYTITRSEPTLLELTSRTADNQRVGRQYMIGGVAVGLLTPAAILTFFLTGSQSFGDACFGGALSWPCATVGILGFISGRAIATTSNTITFDQEAGTIRYTQQSRTHRPRSQTLHYDQVAALRLRTRPVRIGTIIQRMRTISVLEILTDEDHIWIIDSANDPAALEPIAQAAEAILGVSRIEA